MDLSGVGVQSGDFKPGDLDSALDPYLYQIADEMAKTCADRKTVVFLPLVKTSQKFRDILCSRGFRAAEVNGESPDRAEILAAFDRGEYNVLCNSMLLTEGWDCPSVNCVVVLRPTKVRSLYSQMVGRGTRQFPGKTDLLLVPVSTRAARALQTGASGLRNRRSCREHDRECSRAGRSGGHPRSRRAGRE